MMARYLSLSMNKKAVTMKSIVLFLSVIAFMFLEYDAAAQQNFKTQQKGQEQSIVKAYRRRKVSQVEYDKLMHEQSLIKQAIKKYEADGYWDPHEKNVVAGKLERADKRLKRYKTNWEK
jgi:hypothetical protein